MFTRKNRKKTENFLLDKKNWKKLRKSRARNRKTENFEKAEEKRFMN